MEYSYLTKGLASCFALIVIFKILYQVRKQFDKPELLPERPFIGEKFRFKSVDGSLSKWIDEVLHVRYTTVHKGKDWENGVVRWYVIGKRSGIAYDMDDIVIVESKEEVTVIKEHQFLWGNTSNHPIKSIDFTKLNRISIQDETGIVYDLKDCFIDTEIIGPEEIKIHVKRKKK